MFVVLSAWLLIFLQEQTKRRTPLKTRLKGRQQKTSTLSLHTWLVFMFIH